MTSTLDITVTGRVARVDLARPQVHNAFDDVLVAELSAALVRLDRDPALRCIVLSGQGSTFSAGADLNWMRGMARANEAENRADSERLAALMRTLDSLAKPTLARVNGSAYGGGVGLVACCDVAIAADHAKFGLTEVKLGLVPAVISPYVVAAIGARQARRLFVTGEIFDAMHALRIGLLHECVPAAQLDEQVDRVLHWLAKGGPLAQREAKHLALQLGRGAARDGARSDMQNAALIARLRVSPEGQEGLAAFLDKRPPHWIAEGNS